ncbi:MAG: shiE, partial [Planctomycetaceae bacterium]|nr:shiE [Planctomycetaceae bacterium]
MQEWLTAELRGLDLGDKRLNKRQAILLDKLAANPK